MYNHPPPPPEHTPSGVKDELQSIIQNIITSDDSVTPHSIIAGKFFSSDCLVVINDTYFRFKALGQKTSALSH